MFLRKTQRAFACSLLAVSLYVQTLIAADAPVPVPSPPVTHSRAKIATDAILTGTTAPAEPKADAKIDTEPVVMTIYRNNGTYTLTAYIKDPLDQARIHYAGTNDNTWNGDPMPLPLPASFSRSGDPMCSANPYSTGSSPRTIFCTGVMLEGNPGTVNFASAIGVWRLSEMDSGFGAPVNLETTTTRSLDKPSIAVSWHSGTRGRVYVAAIENPVGPGSDCKSYPIDWHPGTPTNCIGNLRFYSSEDGLNFAPHTLQQSVFSGRDFHSPIVVVDPVNGDVYLLWLSWAGNKVYLARSTDGGVSWDVRKSFDAGTGTEVLVRGGEGITPESVGAARMLMARYNSITNSIGVVWHRREEAGEETDQYRPTEVVFNHYDTRSQSWGCPRGTNGTVLDAQWDPQSQAWRCPRAISSTVLNAQWNPALDYDESGAYLVSYYDMRDDSATSAQYRLYASHIDARGNQLEPDQRLCCNEPGYATGNGRTLGEYQDVWYFGGAWYLSWIHTPSPFDPGTPHITRPVVSPAAGPPSAFYLITPCRLLDTRNPDGPYGGPALPPGAPREIQATGACGIPATAKTLAVNVTAILPLSEGSFNVYPSGTTPAPALPSLYYRNARVRANHTLVPLSTNGRFTVTNNNSGGNATHFCVDVSGYFQ